MGIFCAKKAKRKGFTLLEILIVIAIIAIIAAIVIVNINPAKQLGEARNAERIVDLNGIANALYQYSIDNGTLPGTIPNSSTCELGNHEICRTDENCGGVDLDILTDEQLYMVQMPNDPSSISTTGTDYYIAVNDNDRITLCAPLAERGLEIEVVR